MQAYSQPLLACFNAPCITDYTTIIQQRRTKARTKARVREEGKGKREEEGKGEGEHGGES